MNRFDKFLSYLYPTSIDTAGSPTNPFLEVVYQDGKYILNSTNTNYSYSGLYDLFKLVFQNVKIDWGKIHNVLILGFGAGCVVSLIQEYNLNCSIVGVEVDDRVLELGRKYFKIDELQNTEIIHADAIDYINKTCLMFDLIIIDIYIDRDVPSSVESMAFIQNLYDHLSNEGTVIFNKLMYNKEIKEQIPHIHDLYKEVFSNVELLTFMETGKIFVARKVRRI